MRRLLGSPLVAAVGGGVIVAVAFLALGITGRRSTHDGDAADSTSVGIAFAVPINTARRFVDRLEHGTQALLPFLGVDAGVGHSRSGAVVEVEPGGPAANGGVENGDVVSAIDGHRVHSISEIDSVVASRLPGEVVTLALRRGHKPLRLRLVLGSRSG